MNFDPSNPQYRSVRSRFKEALKEPANMIGMAGFFGIAAALLTPVPLLIGCVIEAAYLLFVPDSAWFTRRLDSRFDAEVKQHRLDLKNKVFPRVRDEVKQRFNWLEQSRAQIEDTAPTQDPWFREALRKLDFLMEKYLQFADREAEYLNYLCSLIAESYNNFSSDEIHNLPLLLRRRSDAPPATGLSLSSDDVTSLIGVIQGHYEGEISALGDNIDKEQVFATKEILSKRKEVLARRREFIVRLSDMMVNLRHQMELIAETFGLINDEMRARSPEQVLADIDQVVIQATSLTDALDSVTPTDQLVANELAK